jgi:hypothetical protein
MLLIQQVINTLNRLTEKFNCLVESTRNLIVSSANHEQVLCNHKQSIEALRADVLALDAKIDAIPDPEDPDFASPIQTATAIIPNNADKITVQLPLNASVISAYIVNTTVIPTEELSLANFIITSNQSSQLLELNFNGLSNVDTLRNWPNGSC